MKNINKIKIIIINADPQCSGEITWEIEDSEV